MTRRGTLLLLCGLALGCPPDRPPVERFAAGGWQAEPFRVASLQGRRDGATIHFVLLLAGPGERALRVEGTVEIDPRATLVAGRWEERGGSSGAAGVVSSASVDFFGGQGGRPALGGQFTLARDGAPVYRVNLPAMDLSDASFGS